jgi:hypothetical protein
MSAIIVFLKSLKSSLKWQALILAMAALVFFYLSYTGLIERNAVLTRDLSNSTAGVKQLSGNIKDNFLALQAREEIISQLTEDRDNAIKELESLYQADKDSGDWAGAIVPGGVINRLRQ